MLFGLGSGSVVESVAAVPVVVDELVEPLEAELELEGLVAEPVVDEVDELVVDVDEEVLSVSPVLGGGGTNMTARTSSEIFRSKALAN